MARVMARVIAGRALGLAGRAGWAGALLALGWAGAVQAASGNSATATGMASATIVAPVQVATLSDLDFGNVASDGPNYGQNDGQNPGQSIGAATGPAQVSVGADGATRFEGAARPVCLALDCPMPHSAGFSVAGEAGRSYTITAPLFLTIAPRPLIDGNRGPDALGIINTMPQMVLVDAIEVRTASRPQDGAQGQLDDQGHDRFEIGGRLVLPAGLPPARYVSTIKVIVAYS